MFTPQNGDRPTKPNHVVILSDGDYPDDENYLLALWESAKELRRRNVFIQAVGWFFYKTPMTCITKRELSKTFAQ